jgi:hypothetical protein
LPLLFAYADAQFDYTGNGFPFGALRQFVTDEGDDEGPPPQARPASGISVLRRHDYAVTDEASLWRLAGRPTCAPGRTTPRTTHRPT